MRNLKKILALVMALVMSLSLVTIANAADFTDNDDISYEEAADVMSAIGIIEGFEDGSFDPDGTLTREQAATLVTRMLLGDNADNLGVEGSTFKDVAASRWSASAIEYCASLGLIDGAGDGNFYPAGQLTANAFAKILLTALGYSSEKEELTGPSWSVNVAALAMEVGLDDGIEGLSWTAVLTREEAAQMALNAICAPLVAYDNSASVTINGTEVAIGGGSYYYITTTLAREQRISTQTLSNTGEYTVEFGERYFPDLRLSRDDDNFDRPSHTWTYKTEEIGTYVDYDKLVETYTAGVTGRDLYNLLSASVIREYDVYYYVDGHAEDDIKPSNMIRTNTFTYSNTGKGVLTQVFVDHDEEEITITSINTYLAKATADYNESKGELAVEVYSYDYTATGSPAQTYNKTIDVDVVSGIEDYKKDDFILVNWAETKTGTYPNNMEIVKVTDPDVMTDVTLTKYSKNSYVVADGEEYNYAKRGTSYNADPLKKYEQTALTNFTYNIYLDQYGYVIGTEVYSGEANYLFLTGYDLNGSNLSITTATAGAIFLDGSFQEIQVDVSATNKNLDQKAPVGADDGTHYPLLGHDKYTGVDVDGVSEYNMWFTYTTSEKSGKTVYTLKPIDSAYWAIMDANGTADTKINSSSVRVVDSKDTSKRAYGNDDSVYITVDTGAVDLSTKKGITKVTGTYTGVQDVDLKVFQTNALHTYKTNPGAIFAVYDEEFYIIGAVVVGEDANSTDNYAYILADAQNEYVDADDNYYWDFKAVVDGEIVTLTVKEKYSSVITATIQGQIAIGKSGLMKLTYDADGYVIGADVVEDSDPNVYGDSDFGKDPDPNNYKVYTLQYKGTFGVKKYADFKVVGRTLYNAANLNDAGLTLESGAPVIVVQNEKPTVGNAKLTYTAYSTIDQALAALLNYHDFEGWVSAVLNDKGTAEFIVLKSDDPIIVTSDDPTIPSKPAGYSATVNVATRTVSISVQGPVAYNATYLANCQTAAYNALLEAGYEVESYTVTPGSVTLTGCTAKNVNSGTSGIAFTVAITILP